MGDILNLVDASHDSRHVSVEQALNDALSFVGRQGAFENGKKILILCLDDSEDQYVIDYLQAGMKNSECVALCDVAKNIFKKDMNY